MKTVVLGLAEREVFALSLLLGKVLPNWACEAAAVNEPVPEGDLYVLDVDVWQAWHGGQCTAERLRAYLGERPAVLIAKQVDTAPAGHTAWVRLGRPFKAADMHGALKAAWQARVPYAAPIKPVEVTFTTSVIGLMDAELGRVAPAPASDTLPELGSGSLSVDAFRACVDSSPHEASRKFLARLGQRAAEPGAFELGVTLINGIIFDPAQQWVASNTPLSVLRMMCRSRSLSEHVQMLPLGPGVDARVRAERRGMAQHDLGDMLYVLARLGECRLPA